VPFRIAPIAARAVFAVALAGLTLGMGASAARSEALLLVDTDSGRVLHAENAGYPWYPASITKIMTTYVTLKAVKEGRIKLDTLITVSENALAQQPSKMGFPVGTQMTVDNALKMLMVKSANDIAVVLAEAVSGSVEAFATDMNKASQRLGMTQSSWVNPNGLPADGQITSARDMAILARAMIREFPQHDIYWRAPAIRVGKRVMRNYNKLIDRYPGADGMKTGFICASGYNLVATASRNGKRMIAVVLGAPSGTQRAETAAKLLEKGFAGNTLNWLLPSLGSVDSLQPIAAAPPNLREEICGKGRRNRTDHAEEETAAAPSGGPGLNVVSAFANALQGPLGNGEQASLIGPLTESMAPIPVSIIPPKGMAAANPEALMHNPRKKRGRVAIKGRKGKQQAVIQTGGKPKSGAKPAATKPAAAKPAAAKPAAAKPAAPKAATPKAATAKPASTKPAAPKPKPGAASKGKSAAAAPAR
jgi:D-alanyl-D-alanine carboxypeptidase